MVKSHGVLGFGYGEKKNIRPICLESTDSIKGLMTIIMARSNDPKEDCEDCDASPGPEPSSLT